MEYSLIKAINNNVVLVKEPDTRDQLILMAKGIGYNRKSNETISDDDLKGMEVIKFLNTTGIINSRIYGKDEIKSVVSEIARSAAEKFSIENRNFYPALMDHICFAIDRVQFGVPIENPFINEISVLYTDEYKQARNAVKTIKNKLGIDLGNDEAGFIALHFYSAKRNTPVSISLKNVRVLNEIVGVILKEEQKNSPDNSSAVRAFLLTVNNIMDFNSSDHSLRMPRECGIAKALPQSKKYAVEIGKIIRKETGRDLSTGDMDFLTVGIEQLSQQISRKSKGTA